MLLLIVSLLLSYLVMNTSFYFEYEFIISIVFLLLAPMLHMFQFIIEKSNINDIKVSIKRRSLEPMVCSSKVLLHMATVIGSILVYLLCIQLYLLEFAFVFLKCLIFLLPIFHIFFQRKQTYFLLNVLFSGAIVIFWRSIDNFYSLIDDIGMEHIQAIFLWDTFLWAVGTLIWGGLGECLLRYFKSKNVKNF